MLDITGTHNMNSVIQVGKFQSVIIAVRSAFASVYGDKIKYRTLLSSKDDAAQNVLDLLQLLLDYPQSDASQRNRHLTTLLKLSKKTSLYPRCFNLKEIERRDGPVTAGHFGEIWKGKYLGKPVCLKIVKVYERSRVERLLKAFWKEALLWAHISHINVLPFYGVFHLDDPYGRICLVSPWMENGNINDYLRQNPEAIRLLLISDIIDGIQYLHHENIVHGDLKGVNILVTESGRACLADFGLSSVMDGEILKWTSSDSSNHGGGTLRWQAPELMLPEELHGIRNSKASDIYAFSCVCYEILTGQRPFHEVTYDAAVMFKIMSGEYPSRPAYDSQPFRDWGLTDSLWILMTHCWEREPEDRPSASEVKERLPLGEIVDSRTGGEQSTVSSAHFRNAMHGASGRFTEEHLRQIISQTSNPLSLLLGLSDSPKKPRKSDSIGRRSGGPRPPLSPMHDQSYSQVSNVQRQSVVVDDGRQERTENIHSNTPGETVIDISRPSVPTLSVDCSLSTSDLISEEDINASYLHISNTKSFSPSAEHGHEGPEPQRNMSYPGAGPSTTIEYLLGKTVDNNPDGRVYLALNIGTKELMAAKFPLTAKPDGNVRSRSSKERLRSEISILRKIDHPNIVRYIASSETTLFLEYVSGGSIRSCLRYYGRLKDDITKSFATQILSALGYLHSQGIIHGNLRSDNILLISSGLCKICGFGRAKRTEGDRTLTSLPGKSQWWTGSETTIANDDATYDAKVDIWSLGCVMIEMWTGTKPWKRQFSESSSPPRIQPDNFLSALADDFRQNCFVVNPWDRPGAKDLIQHPYLILPPSWAFAGFL